MLSEYYIKNKKYKLESKINKKELIAIGDFLKILKCEKIENVTLKNLREWDNKKLLQAFRVAHGPIREKVRYYTKQHINIVIEILRLKSLGFEIPDIKKVILNNTPENLILLNKDIDCKKNIKNIKDIIRNINDKELYIIKPMIKNAKKYFLEQMSIKELNYDDIKNILIKNKYLNYDVGIIIFALILLSSFNCYDIDNDIFDSYKFSKYIDDIADSINNNKKSY
ncbi:MerR family transcriptional regulator [Brachyspira hyodysenteriae]|uniref:MerR family transcriptional regulator n=1 Tax=Brachyspira hyodysenteriae ATCC 27164 TaxID=1266923 RepID=A0A3B6VS71_BRAHO|nr:MerR family transcriptional regulator [Brachyspira hyodysenteriae]ANN63472.1 MerR family transcriptional regulator [Brachyspira hyodysenteriae ATCC 27164]AUJ50177.1 MerR family transcriptional regulator [Brachyspira hyodysenteriae]KLI18670.1 MerR family transcriptional regulator [Brachyspira hyodysenteriae]KLI21656.1 MerR family transcriptional regulator [Brachyspira hyodysenteriae]KLI24531.1 MerR family transcriptional regulator [Brachyspira hyodysenteriae]